MERLRVLLVDDSPEMRHLLRMILRRDDRFEVVGEAGDGREAVEQAERVRPDLVLLDLRMPVMDGYEALPLLRERHPAARVVVVSGLDPLHAAPKALALGAHGYIEKDASPQRFQRELLALADAPGHVKA